MTIQTQGRERPRLTLPFGGTRAAKTERRAPELSGHELRRIVSEMLG